MIYPTSNTMERISELRILIWWRTLMMVIKFMDFMMEKERNPWWMNAMDTLDALMMSALRLSTIIMRMNIRITVERMKHLSRTGSDVMDHQREFVGKLIREVHRIVDLDAGMKYVYNRGRRRSRW